MIKSIYTFKYDRNKNFKSLSNNKASIFTINEFLLNSFTNNVHAKKNTHIINISL